MVEYQDARGGRDNVDVATEDKTARQSWKGTLWPSWRRLKARPASSAPLVHTTRLALARLVKTNDGAGRGGLDTLLLTTIHDDQPPAADALPRAVGQYHDVRIAPMHMRCICSNLPATASSQPRRLLRPTPPSSFPRCPRRPPPKTQSHTHYTTHTFPSPSGDSPSSFLATLERPSVMATLVKRRCRRKKRFPAAWVGDRSSATRTQIRDRKLGWWRPLSGMGGRGHTVQSI